MREKTVGELILGAAWADTGFVLVLADGQPPNPDSMTRRFRRDCERLGLMCPTIHGLRHAFATTALENNAVHVLVHLSWATWKGGSRFRGSGAGTACLQRIRGRS